nr:hypothetical protein [Desulfobacula sp.]
MSLGEEIIFHESIIFEMALQGPAILIWISKMYFYEAMTGKIPVESINPRWFVQSNGRQNPAIITNVSAKGVSVQHGPISIAGKHQRQKDRASFRFGRGQKRLDPGNTNKTGHPVY